MLIVTPRVAPLVLVLLLVMACYPLLDGVVRDGKGDGGLGTCHVACDRLTIGGTT